MTVNISKRLLGMACIIAGALILLIPLILILNQSQGGNYILQRWQRRGRCKHQCVGSGL